MLTRLFFDLQWVAEHARHAVHAEHHRRTEQEIDLHVPARPALCYFRSEGRIYLSSNGLPSHCETHPYHMSGAHPHLSHPAAAASVCAPDFVDRVAIPLLEPTGMPLFNQLCDGLAAGWEWLVLDPQNITVSVARRRRRQTTPHRRTTGHTGGSAMASPIWDTHGR
jgi:hypothetical protein